MITTNIGKQAESAVADFLLADGYKILDQNWKTKVCEIDIVAQKGSVIQFAEVKYRSSEAQGSGLDYITPRKLGQMQYAARIWNQQNSWEGDYRLVAAEVSGPDFSQISIIEIA